MSCKSSSHKFDPSYQFSLKFHFIFSNISYGNYPSFILVEGFNTRNAKDGISRQGRGIQFFKPSHLESCWFKPNLVLTWLRNGLPKSQNGDRECNDEHRVHQVVIGPKMAKGQPNG